MLSLVYITGYAERYKEDDEETEDDTLIYYQKYSEYFDALDWGSNLTDSTTVR